MIILLIPIAVLALFLIVLLALSPGKPKPFLDESGRTLPGSISEKVRVEINGVEQGMFIKGKNRDLPVLLFLHGGTGMPEYFLTRTHPTGLEDNFVVCWWERRGCGLSYDPHASASSISIDQLIADTLAVSHYLRSRFHKDKILLLAHSGGSFFGIQAAAQAPELYEAYIGTAQMTFQLRSEWLAYDSMLGEFRKRGDKRMIKEFEKAKPGPGVPLPPSYMKIRDKAMHRLGIGTMREMKSVWPGVFLPSWLCPDYTLGEKINIWRGKFQSDRILWDRMISTDLSQKILDLKIPAYFLHGKFDRTVSYDLAKEYFKKLKAPLKGFYTFDRSAHSPMFEEPEKFNRILNNDVRAGTNKLADAD